MAAKKATTMKSKPQISRTKTQDRAADVPTHTEYDALSLRDLLDARDQYHIHLMRHPKVVATAVGYYRIRQGDSRPGEQPVVRSEGPRTLENSEVRTYSWPAVLVFVEEWIAEEEFAKGRRYD